MEETGRVFGKGGFGESCSPAIQVFSREITAGRVEWRRNGNLLITQMVFAGWLIGTRWCFLEKEVLHFDSFTKL